MNDVSPEGSDRSSTPSPPELGARLFAYPLVGKAGLGNMLFPWARAEVFAESAGARLLAPRWARFRLGPYLRREPDKRRYSGSFFAREHVHGLQRIWTRLVGRRVRESCKSDLRHAASSSLRPVVVEFHGLGEYFTPLLNEADFLRNRLERMTDPALRSARTGRNSGFIGIHVRRGDITRQGFSERELGESPQYTQLAWFVEMASALRRVDCLRSLPIVVFSDGDESEVGALLELEGVTLQIRRPAVADLWELSSARLLVASGFSTFSMWASFLGGMPTIYAPGKIQQLVQVARNRGLEIELQEGAELPEAIVEAVLRRPGS